MAGACIPARDPGQRGGYVHRVRRSLKENGYNKGGLAALSIAETAAWTDRLIRVVPLNQAIKRRSSIFRVA